MRTTEKTENKTFTKSIANSTAMPNIMSKMQFRLQPQLTIGKPNDKYEEEADNVANQVMRMPDPVENIQRKCGACEDEETMQTKPISDSITPWIQTQPLEEEEEELQAKSIQNQPIEEEEEEIMPKILQRQPVEEEEEPIQSLIQKQEVEEEPIQTKSEASSIRGNNSWLQTKLNNNKGGGSPLPDNARSFMETRFGTDFSHVRIHNNSSSVEMNRSVHSQAFTNGNNIYFNVGKYNPDSDSGRKLLAHELTHVIQQQPQLFKSPEEESETTSTFKELETATKDVKKYIDYITECAERSKRYGVPLPENIKKAAERIMEISQYITSKLNLVEAAIDTAQQGLDWAKGIYSVASAIASLDLNNKASLRALFKSINTLNNATKPAQTWVESLGRKGGAAARFSFIFSVVVAQVEIGMKALSKGIEHAHAREARIRSRITTLEKSTERRTKIPPAPSFPLTEAEEKALCMANKEQTRIQTEQNLKLMFRQHFNESEFPRRDNYPKYRPQLLLQIREALLARLKRPQLSSEGTSSKLDEEKWWECFTNSGEERYDYGEGIYLYPRKTNINYDEAFWEIHDFMKVDPPCPFFDALYLLAYEEFYRREYKNFTKKILSH